MFPVFQFPPRPTGISAPICVALFTKPYCPNPASRVCLFLVSLCHPSASHTPITIACALSQRQREKGRGRNCFSPSVHIAILLKFNLLLLNAKVACYQNVYTLPVYEYRDDSGRGSYRRSALKTILLLSVLTQHPGGQERSSKFNFGVINFLKGSITSPGRDLRATCTRYI